MHSNRARFIALIVAKKLHINNRKKADIVKDLTRLKFQKFGEDRPPRTGFEYLLIMQIASLTKERKEELERMAKDKANELEIVKRTSPTQMWLKDLAALEKAIEGAYTETIDSGRGKKRKSCGGSRSSGRGRGRGRKAGEEDGDGGEDGEEGEGSADVDPLDNPFADIQKWTAGYLNAAGNAGPPMKKR